MIYHVVSILDTLFGHMIRANMIEICTHGIHNISLVNKIDQYQLRSQESTTHFVEIKIMKVFCQ